MSATAPTEKGQSRVRCSSEGETYTVDTSNGTFKCPGCDRVWEVS